MLSRPRKPRPGSEQLASLPAPIGGLNTSSSAMNMPATDCMLLYNMLAAENGLRARLGSREWVTGLTGSSDNLVRTVIPYAGSSSTATRLFVTTSTGIYNATTSHKAWRASTSYVIGDTVLSDHGKVYTCDTDGISAASGGPTGTSADTVDGTTRWDYTSTTLALSFSSSSGLAGYGVAHAHTTTAGNFIWYADEVNGLHLYTESTGLWAAVTAITGVTETNLVFVTVFKGFTLFAEKDTANIWILPVNSVAGAATRMGLGYKLQAGGYIVGMFCWTYDGGGGLDDALVVITSGGDVIVFQGTDPTDSSAFGITGAWGVGKMPAGRNLATAFGGDLLLLTRSGIVPMSKLVLGRADGAEQYETAKIHNLFNRLMLTYGDVRGWSLSLHPEESALVVTVPTGTSLPTTQLAMSLATRSWSQLRDLDIYSCAAHEGKLYYGTIDGKVGINDGDVDGVTLTDPTSYSAIQYSGITAFQNMGTGSQKQVHMIKPYFVSQSRAPNFSVGARYDFNVTELGAVTLAPTPGASVWGTGAWDNAIWGGGSLVSTGVRGTVGMGSNVAIAWRGASVDRTVLTGFEISYSAGGML